MITIHSFDVFDTCLIRKVAAPSHVFYEVAKKVFTKLGIPISRPFVEDFVATRIQSEQAARQQSGREDIALHEIWQKLVQSMGWQYDDSLAQLELDTEEELYAPVSSIRKQVQAARQQGCRVIFVSDMYLPKEFITRQLVKHGFAEEGDGFYVSGEIGKTKASGNLYRYLLAQENVLGSNIWHTGDNQYSDYTVPRTLGIRAGRHVNPCLVWRLAMVSEMRRKNSYRLKRRPARLSGTSPSRLSGRSSREAKCRRRLCPGFLAWGGRGFAMA